MKMDADEELARKLQAEEDAAAAALISSRLHLRSSHQDQSTFIHQIEDGILKVNSYEDEIAQAIAISVMDLDKLQAQAHDAAFLSQMLEESPPLAYDDALAYELLHWFKQSFFHWVNNPPCSTCQSSNTVLQKTTGAATDEETYHKAHRVEVYHCTACSAYTRFPRYNDPIKLLETRRGRCGEWANCFALCCRAVGLDTRLVLDFTDHVWVEYYSTAVQRWIHMDPCEAALDKPLLYSIGWGKKLTYCIAISKDGVLDVTKRYVKQYNETLLRRTMVDETWLQGYITSVNERVRESFDEERRNMLKKRDEDDMHAMHVMCELPLSVDEKVSLPGRQTGSAEWITMRGEGGGDNSDTSNGDTTATNTTNTNTNNTNSTRYSWAPDVHLSSIDPGRICGGAVRASADNPPSETIPCLFDGTLDTKWLDFNGIKSNTSWVEYRVLPAMDAVVLTRYALTSANDAEERDPREVVMEGYDEGKKEWVVLDERKVKFDGRLTRVEFVIDYNNNSNDNGGNGSGDNGSGNNGDNNNKNDDDSKDNDKQVMNAYRIFRLRIVSVLDPGRANSVQLGKLDLYSDQ